MKIHSITARPAVTIESVIRFDPWPFKENYVELDSDVLWWDDDRGLNDDSTAEDPYTLFADDCDVLVTLSNGRTVVTDKHSIHVSDFVKRLEAASSL
jgi:hypothetical protein